MFFVVLGTACATEITDASISEDSNLTIDNANVLSQENLEVSNEVSISETNLVNSHDDNLEDYPEDDSLKSIDDSYYEDNGEQVLGLANVGTDENLSVADNPSVVSVSSKDAVLSQSMVSTKLSVSNTHYDKSATYFKVTLQDSTGKALNNQKISLKVSGKTYSATTDKEGIALVKTAALAIGTYNVTVTYAGSGNYSSKSLSKNVKVLSSVTGNDLTKYYGDSTYYYATFWKDNDRLSYTKVTFNVGGKQYTVTTNINGVAKFKTELNPGKYTITTTNPYTNEKLSNTLVVNKDKTNITGKYKTYVLMKNKYTYEVNLTTAHGSPVKDAKVYFTYSGKTVTATTDSNGKASIVIPALERGTYNITYTFKGNKGLDSSSSSGVIVFKYANNKLIASDLTMTYNDGSQFSVKLTDTKGNALSGKTIKFTVNDKVYRVKTDSNGIAKLNLNGFKPGTYKVNYSYSTLGASNYNYGSKNLVINKITLKISAGNLVMKYRDGSLYKATVKDSSGKVVKNVGVKFNINGKTYTKKTDSNGIAKLKVTCTPGYYPIKSYVSSAYYKSNSVNKKVVVNGTKFIAKDLYIANGKGVTYSVKVTDIKNKIVKGATVKFTVKSKTYTRKTDSSGIAKVYLGKLSGGNHKIHFVQDSGSGTRTIHVIHKVTLKQVISASQYVKSYVLDNSKLPSTIKLDKIEISTATYLYIVSNAIKKLSSGKNSDYVYLKTVKSPSKAGDASDMGNLKDYLAVAKNIAKTANEKGQMPNDVSSSLGDIGYKGVVYAFARVVAYYGDEGVLPSYVEVTSLSDSSLTSKLNSKNTIRDLAAYLAASTNCQVNNAKIKQLVSKLTQGLTSDKDKATAIYNYVRDAISYSFYYDTKYGAVGTLEAGSGNCVDHSHLLVAMYRTAGLPARYVHGTCTFTSGTYGHVWTQVLIGNTWVVSDATSARNSFGNVVNWNADSYSLKGYYPSIAF